MDRVLYKYRGIQNFRFFVDIILKKRLFAAKYVDLNDPMEGKYYYNAGQLNKEVLQKISSDKEDLRICSLSRKKNDELMWAHYSEGHRGVAIGITVDIAKYDLHRIEYDGLTYLTNGQIEHDTPREILTHKLHDWLYEEEERIFVTDNYVEVKIKEIITGRNMNKPDFSFIRELVNKIDSSIKIIKADTFM